MTRFKLALGLALLVTCMPPVMAEVARPAISDPSSAISPPASMAEIAFKIHGARTNGLIYLAAGPGPHPLVIFLHGFPGNEKNLDLAQAVRRAGYHAIYAEYRGAWGSGGNFSFTHGLEDVASIIEWARDPANAEKFRMDSSRIALVGHSYGGWLALMSGAVQPSEVCVAALDAWNLGGLAEQFGEDEKARAGTLAYFRDTTDPNGGPLRAKPDDLLAEMTGQGHQWNYVTQAEALKSHALLSIAVTRDGNQIDHDALDAAIAKAGGTRLQSLRYDDDHPMSSHRIALAETVIGWLNSACADSQAPAAPTEVQTQD